MCRSLVPGWLNYKNFIHAENFNKVTLCVVEGGPSDYYQLEISIISNLIGEQVALKFALLSDHKGPFTTGRQWCQSQDIGTVLNPE